MFCIEAIHRRDKDAPHRCVTCMGYINAIHRYDPEMRHIDVIHISVLHMRYRNDT